MFTLLVLLAQFAAGDDLGPRIATLQKHLDRLHAITTPENLNAEKEAKLADLQKSFETPPKSVEEFNALYVKMDEVRSWLIANSAARPAKAEGTFEALPEAWRIKTPQLEFSMSNKDGSITIHTPKETWVTAALDDHDVEAGGKTFSLWSANSKKAESFDTGYSVGMSLDLSDFPDAPGFELILGVNLIGNEIVFEIAAPGDSADLGAVNWPKAILGIDSAACFSVIPHMQGVLLPGDWPQEISEQDLCNSRSLYMPWWGQIRNGHGVQTILETSDDAGATYTHNPGGPTVVTPRWYSSLGKLRYLRTVRYVFDDDATYVSMAKRYRKSVIEEGRFVSLNEKRVRTPNLDEVIGRPVVHLGALYHFVKEAQLWNKDIVEANHALNTFDELAEQLRNLKSKGIDDAYVHLDGWGFYGYDSMHPDVLPPGEEQGGWDGLRRFADTCDELGYLFATHDQYRDYYTNAVSYDKRLALMEKNGNIPFMAVWCGGPQSVLSARFAPEYVRRNHDLFAANGVKVKGAYLDVLSVVPIEESFDKAHPMTRSDCARYRKECFGILHAKGYVMSSEEPTDYLASTLELVHHGPYPTSPHLGGGDPVGIPIPLFNLVYHDSLLTPWDMGENGGWGIPNGDAGRLHCVLNAGLPYVGPGASEKDIARVKEAAELSKRCATQEMTNHEFLDASRRKQASTFADGTKVTIDFDSKEYKIEYGKH
jgi:hypothetical protein